MRGKVRNRTSIIPGKDVNVRWPTFNSFPCLTFITIENGTPSQGLVFLVIWCGYFLALVS